MYGLPFAVLALPMVVLFAVGVGAIVVLGRVAVRQQRERAAALAAWADAREWLYSTGDTTLVDRFTGAPFGRGSSRRATDVVRGRFEGRDVVTFDYTYVSGSGDDSTTHRHSVAALHLGVRAPDLAVGPTTTLRRWVDSLTGRDIAIGDPEFDAHFTVHSASPEFARDVLLSDVREVLRRHPNLSWRITGDSILLVRPGVVTPAEREADLQALGALVARIPEPVWQRLAEEPPR